MTDTDWMRQAVTLARRGEGFVEPNPMVGAVVVKNGIVVGTGYHERFGEAHAEVNAIAQAQDRARDGTLYVTLEPCCHFGKTPPCTDAVISAGIRRVVIGMADPFTAVSGNGIAKLREAGIDCEIGVLEPECRRLNAPYLTLIEKRRPFVCVKWAMSLDGKIATSTGQSKWISSEVSRARVHQLRGRMDAIVVGAGTVRADDPLLTARPQGPRVPLRVVLSRDGKLPEACQLIQTAHVAPVLIAGDRIDRKQVELLESKCCEVLTTRGVGELLAEFGKRRFTNVLVEGGAEVLGSFFDAKLIDEVHVFIAPRLIGGAQARSPIAGFGAMSIAEGLCVEDWESETLGQDVYFRGRIAQ